MERVNKPLLGSDTALWAETRQSPPPKLRVRQTAGGCSDDVSISLEESACHELSDDGGGSVGSSMDDPALRPPLAVFCNPLWLTNH